MPLFSISLLAVTAFAAAYDQSKAPEDPDIAKATLPLPDGLKSGASVVRMNAAGFPETIRKGTNSMVCISNGPGNGLDVRCYQEDFIGVVYRGFQLVAEGVHGPEITNRIEAEIKAGKITLPTHPTSGYRCAGPAKGYNAAANEVTNEIHCWESVHFPFRTAHELGLMDESEIPDAMRRKLPFVMSSGTYWAHVMIMHPDGADHAH
jgi:hypothetical protein